MYALSDCIYWEKNTLGDCSGRVEEVDGEIVCEHCRNLKGIVSIHNVYFREDDIVDGDYPRDDFLGQVWDDLTISEAVKLITSEGLDFASTGNDWAANPDGSYIVDYREGKRCETTAHLSDFPDWAVKYIIEKVG